MKWKTDLPTKEGWYWMWRFPNESYSFPCVVLIEKNFFKELESDSDFIVWRIRSESEVPLDEQFTKNTLWIGPIPEPEKE